ncbi:MAG: nuclear transport factor 2 family protein [Proteobacteria bacterium]|nr:nuclear transport factor 2 family protein [Pseudomonadota bacterium]
MHPNHAVVEKFYSCFAVRDWAGMAACYHPEAEFSDPVFTRLKGREVSDMWEMLCKRGKDLEIEFRVLRAGDGGAAVHWDARYTFSGTGRRVLNSIDAEFELRDGMIVRHRDRFDLWRWTRMALGLKGVLLGWLPAVQNAVRAQAARSLAEFRARKTPA